MGFRFLTTSGWIARQRPGQLGLTFLELSKDKPHAFSLFGLALTLVLFTGCEKAAPPIAQLPPTEVTIAEPLVRTFPEAAEFTGRTEAVERAEIRARVGGYLEKINFEEGEEVSAGDVLFEIDQREYVAVLNAAKAEQSRFQATLDRANADLSRNKELYDQGAISQQQFDTAKAEADVQKASLEGAVAAVERAQLDLNFTQVASPVDGKIGKKNLTVGNLIAPDQTTSEPLATVVSLDPMYVYFDVDERTLLRAQKETREREGVREGARPRLSEVEWPVQISLANETDYEHDGYLDFIDNQVDPETGTIRVRGRFDNKTRYLTPGLFVRVRLPMGTPTPHVLVPERAVGTDLKEKYLLVVKEDNLVEYRKVTLGIQTTDGYRVIEEGVEAGEKIIIDGVQRAQPGTKVNPSQIELETKPDTGSEMPELKSPKSDEETTDEKGAEN